ncbi:MAG: (Fe-S)-binding protein, partial [Planctomycetota bacterium]
RLNTWLGSRRRLAIAGFSARFARRSRLLPLFRAVAPAKFRRLTDAIPAHPKAFRVRPGSRFEAKGEVRGSVSLHLGCVDPQMFGEVLQHSIEVLQQEGFHVEVPTQPSCCGALEAHAGAGDIGRHRGNATLRALRGHQAILVPASGCASFLHELDPKLPVMDPMAFLHQVGLRSECKAIAARIAYDPPCHQNNVLKSTDATCALLAGIPKLDLVEAEDAELCCGAGGMAFLREPELSLEVGGFKAQALIQTGATEIVSGNSGCRLQLESSLRAAGGSIPVAHPISLLHRALLG